MTNTINDDDLSLSVTVERDDGSTADTVEVGSPGKQSLKSIFGQRNRKRMIFTLGAFSLLLAGLAYSFISFEPDGVKAPANAGTGGVTTGGRLSTERGGDKESWLQSQERERYNYEALEEVQRENPAAHPLLNPGAPEEVAAAEPVAEAEPVEPPPSPFEEVVDEKPQSVSEAVGTAGSRSTAVIDPELMESLLTDLMTREGDSTKPQLQAVSWSYTQKQPAEQVALDAAATADAASQADEVTGAGVCANPLMRAGRMAMATTDMALNSDVGGPVAVTIRSGPLRNSQLLGSFERAETWLRLSLNRLITPDETIAISAIALDMDTTLNAVEGEVDRHIMERYGWWGIGTVLSAIGTAAERNADSRIVVSEGAVIQDVESDSKRETKIALGELGQDLGELMQDRLNRPITVSLKVGDEIGVFFMDDVCSEMPVASGTRGL